jgi:hypothetical protein
MISIHKCNACSGTGIWVCSELDGTYRIEKCDLCRKYISDQEAVYFAQLAIYGVSR